MSDWKNLQLKDNKPVDVDEKLVNILNEILLREKSMVTAIEEIKELFKN